VKVVADYCPWFFFHIGEFFTLNHCVSVIGFIFFAFRFSCLNFGLAITFKQKKIGTVAGSDERACDQFGAPSNSNRLVAVCDNHIGLA
jgi:hypothetical protein